MSKKLIHVFGIFFILFLYNCGESKNVREDVFSFGLSTKISTLDPGLSTDASSSLVILNVCEPLFELGLDGTALPKLVDSYNISSDGLVYTFHLKKGILFHDGTPLNARAVQFSLLRQRKTSSDYIYGSFAYWESDFENLIKSIDVVDEYTVVFNLNYRSAVLLSKLTMTFSSVVSPKAVKEMKDSFAQAPVCSGPYKMTSWKHSERVLLDANEGYWNEDKKSHFKKILIRILKDSSSRKFALEKGEVDLVRVPGTELKAIEDNPNLKIVEKPIAFVVYLFLNNSKPPLNNKKVRQAVSHLINKDGIIKNVLFDRATRVDNPIPKNMWSYNNEIKGYDFNIEKAKKKLAEAGYANKTLDIDMLYNIESSNGTSMSEILKSDMKKAGINLNIKSIEWGTFLSTIKYNKHSGMNIYGWVADYIDPDNFLNYLFTSKAAEMPANNTSFFKNKKFDAIIKEASEINDKKKRTLLYKEAQRILFEEAAIVPLYSINYTFGAVKSLKDFTVLPTGTIYFNTMKKE